MPIVQVALPVPLNKTFDYLCEQPVEPGMRVRVPFGKRQLIGLIVSESDTTAAGQLKPVETLLDNTPILDSQIFDLCQWAHSYYHSAIGYCFMAAIPSWLRSDKSLDQLTEPFWRLTTEGKQVLANPTPALARAARQLEALQALKTGAQRREQLQGVRVSEKQLLNLKQKGWVETCQEPDDLLPQVDDQPQLSDEQQSVLHSISLNQFATVLLEGATGTGKTEIYLRLARKLALTQQQSLILVPEIGLTPQTVERFEQRLGNRVGLLHSGVSDRQRAKIWLQASRGELLVLVGTRSAVFTPMPKLGLIVVDEEHDLSYKQTDIFPYSARDLAIVRAQKQGIPILLGSATPSLESLQSALNGRYAHLKLTQRPVGRSHPTVKLQALPEANVTGLTDQTLAEIDRTLAAGEQVMVFYNRRGFAPKLWCSHCGWIAHCDSCAVPFTLHQKPYGLHCHHCEKRAMPPPACPKCNNPHLSTSGMGTEQLEQQLSERFPTTPVFRIDRDSVSSAKRLNEMLQFIKSGEPSILVGTQMLAKGHHFPMVTLVAVIDLDQGLVSPDFRSAERLGQLLTQVTGRSGRGERAGQVILQTRYPEHPWLQLLLNQGYGDFAKAQLEERKRLALPPYRHMAIIRVENTEPEFPLQKLQGIIAACPPSQAVELIGPLPALMEKRQGRYRWEIQAVSDRRAPLHQWLSACRTELQKIPTNAGSRWSLNVDPQDMA